MSEACSQIKHIQVEQDQLQEYFNVSRQKNRLANRLEVLFNTLPSGIIILNEKGEIVECNPSAEELLGCTLMEKTWLSVLQTQLAPRNDDGHEISLRNGKRVQIDTNSLAPEAGQLILITDLTHTRELQSRLTHKQQLEKMGEMAAQMAHQLRTPLATAMLYSTHLQADDLQEEKRQQFARKIGQCLSSVEQQIRDMLLFSRGGNELLAPVSVDELVNDVVSIIEPQLTAKGVKLEIQNHSKDTQLFCNRESIIGCIHNLVNNAVDAMADDRRIRFKIIPAQNYIDLIIQDSGKGMSDEVKARVLEPFYTTKTKGTGLGLSVVQAVARAHHGEVWIDSREGEGCRIGIRLPNSNQKGDSACQA